MSEEIGHNDDLKGSIGTSEMSSLHIVDKEEFNKTNNKSPTPSPLINNVNNMFKNHTIYESKLVEDDLSKFNSDNNSISVSYKDNKEKSISITKIPPKKEVKLRDYVPHLLATVSGAVIGVFVYKAITGSKKN